MRAMSEVEPASSSSACTPRQNRPLEVEILVVAPKERVYRIKAESAPAAAGWVHRLNEWRRYAVRYAAVAAAHDVLSAAARAALIERFKQKDADGDSRVSADELAELLRELDALGGAWNPVSVAAVLEDCESTVAKGLGLCEFLALVARTPDFQAALPGMAQV